MTAEPGQRSPKATWGRPRNVALMAVFFAAASYAAYSTQERFPNFFPALAHGRYEPMLWESNRLHFRDPVTAVAWNGDRTRLATLTGWDATVFETTTWKQINQFEVLKQPWRPRSLAFLPDGTLLVPAAGRPSEPFKGAVVGWNIVSGDKVRVYPDLEKTQSGILSALKGPQEDFTVSNDGQLIAGLDWSGVYLYDAKTTAMVGHILLPKVPKTPPEFAPPPETPGIMNDIFSAVAFAPDGKELAACALSGRVYFYDLANSRIRGEISAFPEGRWCTAVAYSADGQFLATGRQVLGHIPLGRAPLPEDKPIPEPDTGGVRIWRTSDSTLLTSFTGMRGDILTLAWKPTENILAVGDNRSLRLWRISADAQTLLIDSRNSAGAWRVAFSSRGQLASAEGSGSTWSTNDVVIYP